jgi:hypothetical protein
MSPQVSPPARVSVGGATELTFRLTVAGAKETVTVSEAAPMVETNPTAVSVLVDDRALADLPLYQQQVFPTYPNAAVPCPRGPVACTLPDDLKPYAKSEISAFASEFKTPRNGEA